MVNYCGGPDTMPMILAPPTTFRAEAPDPAVTPLQPIVPLLRDSTLTEIMINGPDAIYVERDGRVLLTDRRFDDENHLLGAISALVATAGRRIGRASCRERVLISVVAVSLNKKRIMG